MTVIPELKRIHSPDVPDLASFLPERGEAFGILVQAMFGVTSVEGKEAFDIVVCTPDWIAQRLGRADFYDGSHHLICEEFDFDRLVKYLKEYARTVRGRDWKEAAEKLGRLGKWEFEDYRP